ncbi:MAG: ATP-grasp domain-containing protein [Chlorobiaceae bacterium]|nr:ATP-grasp domain-containing protein [Chlorobiaceae bacterium]NTV17671.1 ATP-grasp domain-containing protein [Chlorobiaceae bacterium]
MISIKHEATFFGANPFAAKPVFVAGLTLPDSTPETTKTLEQGCLYLHTNFPEWCHALPSPQQPPAVVIALTAVQWALGALNEVRGYLHDAGAEATPQGARLWLGFHHQNVSYSTLKLALQVIAQAGKSTTFDRHGVDAALTSLWKLCRKHHPDYQTRILMQGARVLDIPVLPFLTNYVYWQYGWGSRSRVFFESMSNDDGILGYQLQQSKHLCKEVFSTLGFVTPRHILVNQISELAKAAEIIGWPCVVKPLFSGGGRGVTAGIRSMTELEAAFTHAKKYTKDAIMVEQFVSGDDHRLMVIDGKLFAAIRREPSTVTGDGRSTIVQLLDVVNSSRSENMMKSRYLRPIAADDVLEQHLSKQGVDLDSILPSGRRITLRSNANLSTGGVCIDVTERVHPHVKEMAETIARTLGLVTVGIDYITTDIERPWKEVGSLIEANKTPSLDVMIAAGQDPVMVASAVLGSRPARIPFQIIVMQQTDLADMELFLKSQTGTKGFGWACNGVTMINGMPLSITRSGAWPGVEALLRNKVVHQVCVVCTAADIVRHGMPVDKVNHVALCGDESGLTNEWLRVLAKHSDVFEKFASWHDCNIFDCTFPPF